MYLSPNTIHLTLYTIYQTLTPYTMHIPVISFVFMEKLSMNFGGTLGLEPASSRISMPLIRYEGAQGSVLRVVWVFLSEMSWTSRMFFVRMLFRRVLQ
ncbi:hypothetical protein EON63_20655 [archaeon]|nr:MAG: hypothetical protein EON63_20655 [archaeon]